MQLPYEWHRQNEKCRICDDVWDGIPNEEVVDIDAAREASRLGRRRRKSCPKCAHRLALEDGDKDLGMG